MIIADKDLYSRKLLEILILNFGRNAMCPFSQFQWVLIGQIFKAHTKNNIHYYVAMSYNFLQLGNLWVYCGISNL